VYGDGGGDVDDETQNTGDRIITMIWPFMLFSDISIQKKIG
jgi:hypothetical protein